MSGFRISNFFGILLFLFFPFVSSAQTALDIITEDHLGGYSTSVAANDQYIFQCEAYGLRVLNFDGTSFSQAGSLVLMNPGLVMKTNNSDLLVGSQNNLIRVGFSDPTYLTVPVNNSYGVTNDEINSIFLLNDKVYITQFNWNTKTGAFRILNKTNLSAVGSLEIACQDVCVAGSNAYVLTGHSQIGAESQILKIYDVSNPANITELASLLLEGAQKLAISGNYLYIVGSGRTGISIVDITNPATPVLLSTDLVVNSGLNRITISGNKLFAVSGKNFYIIDITNPLVPVQESTTESDYYISQISTFTTPNQNNHIVYIGQGTLNSFNVTNPQNPAVGPQNEGPNQMNSMTITGANLFVGDATSIWRYDLANSEARSKYITINNKLISSYGNNLYVVYDESNYSKLKIYDISNISSPQAKGEYSAAAVVSKITSKGNYVYLLRDDSKIIDVIDVSNTNTPVNVFDYQLTDKGTSIFAAKDYDKNILYAGYYGNETSKGVELIDITNPDASAKLSTISTSGKPQGIHASGNNLYLGSHTSTEQGWYLEAFDVTNAQAPVLSAQTSNLSAGEIIWDIFALENRLLVSFTLDGLKTYELVQGTANQSGLFKEISTLNNTLAQTSESSDIHYAHDIAAYQNGTYLNAYVNANSWAPQANIPFNGYKGMYKLQIPDFPPPVAGKVTLTMGVNPATAAAAGCTTNPTPGGQHQYDINSDVSITAVDKPNEGWYFKDWTGASGGKSTSIHMDANKNVIANFVEVTLTASGSKEGFVQCPDKALENPVNMLEMNFCASAASGWTLNGFTIKGYGSGNEALDVKSVNLYQGSTLKFSGTYAADDGQCTVTFSPPIVVPANQCILMNLFYEMGYDENNFARDTAHTYAVKIENINATPIEYTEGLIKGAPQSEAPMIIAQIYNSNGTGFSSIMNALVSGNTGDGDICYVCEGEYTENIQLSTLNFHKNSVTLQSVEGRDRTIIEPADKNEWTVLLSSANNFTLDGFTIRGFGEELGNIAGIYLIDAKVNIQNNKIYGFGKDIAGQGVKESKITNNIFNHDTDTKNYIEIDIINNSEISNNTFGDIFEPNRSITITNGYQNIISNNTSNQYLLMYFSGGGKNIIRDNTVLNEMYELARIIELNNSVSNTISGNKNINVIANNSYKNTIEENKLNSIQVKGGIETKISNNTFNESLVGLRVNASRGKVDIIGNKIESTKGVLLNNLDMCNILNNEIKNNFGEGVKLQDCYYVKADNNMILANYKRGIEATGVKEMIISNNNISHHLEGNPQPSGIYLIGVEKANIINNFLYKNGTAIVAGDCKKVICRGNDIIESQSSNTGIHLNNSSGLVFGNNLLNNNGNGIVLESSSDVEVNYNNISGNSPYQLSNTETSSTINAVGNYWGTEAGPSQSDIFGSVTFDNWLAESADLVVSAESDTVYVTRGIQDSLKIFFKNLESANDNIQVNITDEYDWITVTSGTSFDVTDTTGGEVQLLVNAPEELQTNSTEKVIVTATSSALNKSISDSFYLSIYDASLQYMSISPDSAIVALGDSVHFYVSGSDQHRNSINVTPTWQTTMGTISADGIFVYSEEGTATITATDPVSGITASTIITTSSTVDVENETELPKEYKLYQNYPNPFNPTTTIRFGLPSASTVKLEIYNILGQRVTELVNEVRTAGTHEVKWNSNGLASGISSKGGYASGVYFYMIYIKALDGDKEFRDVKKMLLLK